MSGEPEALQDKIDRLTRERDEMATQASACAEEVDRVRVEIGTAQAEVERLTQICTGLGLDLRIAEGERDDARTGGEIWALRCGVVLGRSPIPDAPADLGRLPAETFWRAARVDHIVRWEDRTLEERQRWAYAEGACIEKARSQAPEVQSLVAENERLKNLLYAAEGDANGWALIAQRRGRRIDRLQEALAESERKRVEAEASLQPFADVAEFMLDFNDGDFSVELPGGYQLTMKPFYAAKEILATPTPTPQTGEGKR